MTFEQIINELPTWARIAIILLLTPTVGSIVAMIKSWGAGRNEVKVKELEAQITDMLSERDERLSNTQLLEKFASAIQDNNRMHREEMQTISDAIRESATIKREDDKETRIILDNNNLAIQQFTVAIESLSESLDKMGIGLHEASETSKKVLNSNVALHNDIRTHLDNFKTVKQTIDTIRNKLGETVTKDEVNSMRRNFSELLGNLDDAMADLSLSVQRNSRTQPIPDEIAKEAIKE